MNTHSVKLHPSKDIWRFLAAIFFIIALAGVPQKTAQAGPMILFVKPIGTGDCGAWDRACTLQTALAKATTPGYELWVMEGNHYPDPAMTNRSATFTLKNGVAIYGGFAGTELIRDNRNWHLNPTTLNGEIGSTLLNTDNSYHVVTASGTNTSAKLDGFTIRDGYASGSENDAYGGGLISISGSPSLTNISFIENHANSGGGGMYSDSSFAMLTNVTFSNNRGWMGGGMHNSNGGPILLSVNFNNNEADESGGGMVNINSDPSLLEVTFNGNTAHYGGGMSNFLGSTATLTNSTFVNNMATNGTGGGMSNSQSNPVLNNVTFYGNSTSYRGGAMDNWVSAPVLNNVTLSGNTAVTEGGAIVNDNSNIIIRNSIIWGNTAPFSTQIISVGGSTPQVTYSDVQGGHPGEGNINSDPLLGNLGTYGSNILTLPLLPGSPAIDTGQDSTCTPGDTRGFLRPLLHHCDMGAYESHGVDLGAVSGFLQSTPILTSFAEPLVISITGADEEPVDGGKVFYILNTSGPSAVPAEPAATISGGEASMTFSANMFIGSYYIVFYTFGSDDLVGGGFYMTNTPNPDISFIYLPLVIR